MPSLAQVNAHRDTSLVQCAISDEREDTYKISLYAGMAEGTVQRVRTTPLPQASNPNKNAITDFTRRSRNRMLKTVAKKRDKSRLMFITLTLRDEAWLAVQKSPREAKTMLQNFMKRVEYTFPHVGQLWRVEYKERLSGRLQGEIAPHFHILIDGIMIDISEVRKLFWRWWHEITTQGDTERYGRSRVDVQIAKNMKHAYYYMSKYVAKTGEIQDNLNIQNYLNTCDPGAGRHWGTRGNWNVAPVAVVTLSRTEWLELRRTIRKWVSKRNKRFARLLAAMSDRVGFSVFGLGDQDARQFDVWDTAIMRLVWYLQDNA